MKQIIIAVDAMGGDNAPGAVVRGCLSALRAHDDLVIRLFGRAEAVRPLLEEAGSEKSRIELIDAPDEITMHDEPMLAVRRKTESSMVKALMDVREKRADAVVSAGSTGALFLGGMAYVRVVRGIDRPALAPVLPGLNKPFLLIDSGANADCQPRYLLQFGLMGSVYMNRVLGVKTPDVGLVNIGVEDTKGNKLVKEAYHLMSAQTVYHFAGNCEARDVQFGNFDVVVTDGFTGNVILKYAEGLTSVLFKQMKTAAKSSVRAKLGGLLLKPALSSLRERMNADEYGGAPLIGLEGTVVKAHGSSNDFAFGKAVEQARLMVLGDVTGRIREGLAEISAGEASRV